MITRRHLLQSGAASVALTRLGRADTPPTFSPPSSAELHSRRDRDRWQETDLHALAAYAVEVATSAGASYADTRLTHIRSQRTSTGSASESESFGVGVRVLCDGFWGFMASAVWTRDEMQRLAQAAVAQAKAYAQASAKASLRGSLQPVVLAPVEPVRNGEWHMPIKYDPFDIPADERIDVWAAIVNYVENYQIGLSVVSGLGASRQQKVFVSSEGSSWKQTTYNIGGGLTVFYRGQYSLDVGQGAASTNFFTSAGKGWEYIAESSFLDTVPQLIADAEQSRWVKPVEVDRMPAVFSAQAMAEMVNRTLRPATELDRAMGYEANAGGTSYVNKPLEMLGTFKMASPAVTLTGNRSQPGAVATVQWDDEAVVPREFTIIQDGILTDFQTTREQAEWLRPWYEKQQKPVLSNGCAGATDATAITMEHSPNLTLLPSSSGPTFDEMIANVKKGVAVISLGASMDQQALNGLGSGGFREIVNGKLGKYLGSAGILFRAPEFWKSVTALGPARDQLTLGFTDGKGEPWQRSAYSISAVPASVTQIDVIDVTRKA